MPLEAARITLMGRVALVPEERIESVQSVYLARHPEAAAWVRFGDFAFYRMAVTAAYYVGGFGVMGWLAVPEDLHLRLRDVTIDCRADRLARRSSRQQPGASVVLG
jgi:hypothetical protein